jgi:hypothetical protein
VATARVPLNRKMLSGGPFTTTTGGAVASSVFFSVLGLFLLRQGKPPVRAALATAR